MGCQSLKMKQLYQDDYQLISVFGDEFDLSENPKQFKSKQKLIQEQRQTFDDMHGLVSGIGVTFNIDGLVFSKTHKGKNMPTCSYELELQKDEHLQFISAHYNQDEGIHDILLKTNMGNMLVMDDNEYDGDHNHIETMEINLADENAALVGFKGMFEDNITRLSIYKATIIEHGLLNNAQKVGTTNQSKVQQIGGGQIKGNKQHIPMRLTSNISSLGNDDGFYHKNPPNQ
eukprot:403348427